MEFPATVARLALAFVFLAAGSAKLADLTGFRDALAGFDLLPRRLIRPASFWLAATELLVGTAWLLGWAVIPAGLLLLALLLVFTLAVVRVLVQGRHVTCGCFGASSRSETTWWTVARNGFLAAVVLLVLLQPAAPPGEGLLAAALVAATLVTTVGLAGAAVGVARGARLLDGAADAEVTP